MTSPPSPPSGFTQAPDGMLVGSVSGSHGSQGDYTQWTWYEIEAAIFGAVDWQNNNDWAEAYAVSNPQTLADAAAAYYYVTTALYLVADNMLAYGNALAGKDDSPWRGDAGGAFHTMVTKFSAQVKANADVLSGGPTAADSVPNQLLNLGNGLAWAQWQVKAVEQWYARQASQLDKLYGFADPAMTGYASIGDYDTSMLTTEMRAIMQKLVTVAPVGYTLTVDPIVPPTNGTNTTTPPPPPATVPPPAPPPPPPATGALPPPPTVGALPPPPAISALPPPPATGALPPPPSLTGPSGPNAKNLLATPGSSGPLSLSGPPPLGVSGLPSLPPGSVNPAMNAVLNPGGGPLPLAGMPSPSSLPNPALSSGVPAFLPGAIPLPGLSGLSGPKKNLATDSASAGAPGLAPLPSGLPAPSGLPTSSGLPGGLPASGVPGLPSLQSSGPATDAGLVPGAAGLTGSAGGMPMMPPPMGMGMGAPPPTSEPSDASGLLAREATHFQAAPAPNLTAAEVGATNGASGGGPGLTEGMPMMPPPMAMGMGAVASTAGTEPSDASGLLGRDATAWTEDDAREAGHAAAGEAGSASGAAAGGADLSGADLSGAKTAAAGSAPDQAAAGERTGPPVGRLPVLSQRDALEDVAAWGAASAALLFASRAGGGRRGGEYGDGLTSGAVSAGDAAWLDPDDAGLTGAAPHDPAAPPGASEPDVDPGLAVWKSKPAPPAAGAEGGAARSARAALGLSLLPGPAAPDPGEAPAADGTADAGDGHADEKGGGKSIADLLVQEAALWGAWKGDSGALE